MKKNIDRQLIIELIISLILFSGAVKAQTILETNNSDFFIKETHHSFFTSKDKIITNRQESGGVIWGIVDKAERKEKKAKNDDPEKFVKFHTSIRTKPGSNAPDYAPNYKVEELNKALQNSKLAKPAKLLNWIERGPGNVSGRTRGILIDAADTSGKTWFAGSVGGGMWKTTNCGALWVCVTPDLPNIATSVIAQCKSKPGIIYCGTGEGFNNTDAIMGSGIFKSTDHGNSWFQLTATLTPPTQTINRIIIDPGNPDIVLACTNGTRGLNNDSQIIKSTDGGVTWQTVFTAAKAIEQIIADPSNFSIQYGTVNSVGIIKSIDGGITWNYIYKTTYPGFVRMELAISQNNSNTLYASCNPLIGGTALLITTDGGNNWIRAANSPTNISIFGQQGYFNNCIAVHPYSDSTLFIGGIDLWKITTSVTGKRYNPVKLEEIGTTSFWKFYSIKGGTLDGRVFLGSDYFKRWEFDSTYYINNDSNYVDVEIRFGPGKEQKAHRFIHFALDTAYVYKDYVTVPFEVWDTRHNVQLMVSFINNADDGVFKVSKMEDLGFVAIHPLKYSPDKPDPNVAKINGIAYQNMYYMLPTLPDGAVWNPANLPDSKIKIICGDLITMSSTYSLITDFYGRADVHCDHHNITVIPKDKQSGLFWIVNGNDGGVAFSSDGGSSWKETEGTGYNTTQLYGVDKKHGADEYICGAQDNGTILSPGGKSADRYSAYREVINADGFAALWNYNNTDLILGTQQNNQYMQRSTDGGLTWAISNDGFDQGGFIAQMASSQSDPDIVFATGYNGIFRSDNFGEKWINTVSDRAGWKKYRSDLLIPVAVSIADPKIIWGGSYYGKNGSGLFISEDQGVTFKNVLPAGNDTLGRITGINTHPSEPNTAYLLYSMANSPKIIRTTDLGKSWQDISGFTNHPSASANGFPDVATYCLLVMPYNNNIIWAGTEIGLFESVDGGNTWHYSNNGLPAVAIWQMKIVDDHVVLATHGRGIFTVTLPELKNYSPPAVTLAPILSSLTQDAAGNISVNVNMRSLYDSTLIIMDSVVAAKYTSNVVGKTGYKISPGNSKQPQIKMIAYKNSRAYKTLTGSINVVQMKQPVTSYICTLDTAKQEFALNNFSISQPAGFASPALHSQHPYSSYSDYTSYLLTPIKISASDAWLEYRDIAIVEPNDSGAVFPGTGFRDYVVIEGSKDGFNWIPVAPGYTAAFDKRWQSLTPYGTPDSTYFIYHKVNLRDKFSAGDVVQFRFRLSSDFRMCCWGWAIDKIAFQKNAVDVKEQIHIPGKYCLYQNYPNPFNPLTTIRYDIIKESKVTFKIFDILGKEVFSVNDDKKPAGKYEIQFNGSNLSSGVYFYQIRTNEFSKTNKMLLLK